MNVWLINPFSDLPNEGASEGRFCCLARMLAEQGHCVTWWTVDFHHRTKEKRPEEGGLRLEGKLEVVLLPVSEYRKNISFARLRSHRDYGKAFADAAAKRIERDPKCAPDVIHLSVPPLDCIAPALAFKHQLGCRVTVDVMDLWPETFTRLIPGGGRLRSVLGRLIFAPMFRKAQCAYREADGVSAVSQEYLDVVKEVAPQQKTHLCYVGSELISSNHLSSSTGSSTTGSLSSALCSLPKVRFIYVGAMTPTYDLDTVIKATQQLKESGMEFEVVFAGSGISEPQLKQQVADRQLGDRVTFLGFLSKTELEAALASSDVGLNTIMPGTFITMPHKLSDYLCAGLVVINSTAGEADDLLRQNHAGTFYEAKDVDSLTCAMRGYIESPQRVINEKASARSLAEASFNRRKTYSEMAGWILAG